MDFVTIAALSAVICGGLSWFIASNRGADPIGWALLGVLLGPIGLVITFVAAKRGEPKRVRRCGQCGQPLNSLWKEKCLHCGALFADVPPL